MTESIFLKALNQEPVPYTPIWIMRQAGRYLPEYRELRTRAKNFMGLCQNPELACEATLQPLARFDLDAAILFSDILTIPDAMGLGLSFVAGEGPKFAKPIRTEHDIKNLAIPCVETKLDYVFKAVKLIRHELQNKIPLIGFSGSPWTLATYMVEGGPSKTFSLIKKLIYDRPELAHELLDKITQCAITYCQAQIDAGAQCIMIFDTWGSILNQKDYEEFSSSYIKKILNNITGAPKIVFCKNTEFLLNPLLDTGCDALGVDWVCDLGSVKNKINNRVALQGNLDPSYLLTSPEKIENKVKEILEQYGPGSGHIFNLGHGITPEVPPEHVAVLVNAVHEFSKPYHL